MERRELKDEAVYRRIGFSVYRLRRRNGLTALVLAERAGIHRNSVYRVESGLSASISVLCRIAVALGVEMGEIISLAPHMVQRSAIRSLDVKKTAKVVCGTEKLFPDPSPAGLASTTRVGRNKGKAKSA